MHGVFVDAASGFGFGVPQIVAAVVADGQIFLVAVATFAQGLDVL
jgi:hypothetical protein